MSQKLPANDFKWVKKLSKFDERFIKNYDENSNKGYEVVLEVDLEYAKKIVEQSYAQRSCTQSSYGSSIFTRKKQN